jgi:hypothetical protein
MASSAWMAQVLFLASILLVASDGEEVTLRNTAREKRPARPGLSLDNPMPAWI